MYRTEKDRTEAWVLFQKRPKDRGLKKSRDRANSSSGWSVRGMATTIGRERRTKSAVAAVPLFGQDVKELSKRKRLGFHAAFRSQCNAEGFRLTQPFPHDKETQAVGIDVGRGAE